MEAIDFERLSKIPAAISEDNTHGMGHMAVYTQQILEAGEAITQESDALDRAQYLTVLADAADCMDERMFEHRYPLQRELIRRVKAELPTTATIMEDSVSASEKSMVCAALVTRSRLIALRLHLLDEERHLADALRNAKVLCEQSAQGQPDLHSAQQRLCDEMDRWEANANG